MPDYKVTFKGDLGNLAQWDAAIRNTAGRSRQELERAGAGLVAQVGKATQLQAGSKAGLYYDKLRSSVDAANRSFIQQGEIVRRVVRDYEIAIDSAGKHKIQPIFSDVNEYDSKIRQRIGDLDKFNEAQVRVGAVEERVTAKRLEILRKQLPFERELASIRERQITTQGVRGQTLGNLQAGLGADQARLAVLQSTPGTPLTKQAAKEIKQLESSILQTQAAMTKLAAPFDKELAALNIEADRLIAKMAALETRFNRSAGQLRRNPAYADLAAAATGTPPINAQLGRALKESPDLTKKLLGIGLGAGTQPGTAAFTEALAKQDAQVSRYVENVRTGVKQVSGSFTDASGMLKEFTIDIDKNGKVIGRWGGQLSGASGFLRQTVRDFQKVIEWTIATTLVFGTLAAVVTKLKSINELNTSLTRLSITAQMTAEETHALFTDLGQVAIDTATPLNDIISVADDIALATRSAGDSTEEWRGKIVALTEAVGVFTNLTGVETVQAADQLSAAFKQLGVAPQELLGVLSKVTAVAGGQAGAIADIVKGLSSVSEAAKAAGFSIDEQIAAIQVLSQVTNKSADEIATSFKNLFGSVSSVGSEKILKSFGIEIRDASGGIRDFLDIYRDVKDALDKGIIPQNRLPDVLRGISGGPRRAPDAAALLSNLGRIDEVVAKSQNATNEALIANAKILDTNAAKIQQFQNAIDIAVFEKFGKTIADLTEFFIAFGTAAAGVFNSIPQGVIDLTVKLGGLVLLGKALTGILKLFGISSLAGPIGGLRALAATFGLVSAQAAKSNQQLNLFGGTGGSVSRLSKGKLGAIGGIGLIAGGALAANAASGGGVDTNTIGSIIQTAGAFATFVPGLQAVGVAALIAGTALQALAGDSAAVTKSAREQDIATFELTQKIKESQTDADNFAKAQREAGITIENLRDKTHKTADEQARLSDATTDYVKATLGLAQANAIVAGSFDELFKSIAGLSDKYSDFKNIAAGGLIPPDTLKELQQELTKSILTGTGQDIFSAAVPTNISSQFTRGRAGGPTSVTTAQGQLNLSDLLKNPALLDRLVGPQGGFAFKEAGQIDATGISFLQSALKQLISQGPASGLSTERLDVLIKAVQSLSESASSFAVNTGALAQQQAGIQSKGILGVFTQDQVKNALQANSLASALNQGIGNYKPPVTGPTGATDPTALIAAQKSIAEFSAAAEQGIKLTNDQLIEAGKNILQLSGFYDELKGKGDETFKRGIVAALEQAGVSTEQLTEITKALGLAIRSVAVANEELIASLDKAKDSAREAFGERSLNLLIGQNSGDFEKNSKGLRVLQEQNRAAYESTLQLIDGIGQLSQGSFVDLNNALAGVIGLQGEYLSQTEIVTLGTEGLAERQGQLGQKLIETAVKAGVNAEGIKKITVATLQLSAAIAAIPNYKQIVIDIKTLQSVGGPASAFAAQAAAEYFRTHGGVTAGEAASNKQQKDLLKDFQKLINSILKSGRGSQLGQLPKAAKAAKAAAPYNQPGLLDIPEEIVNSPNYQSLLQQAVSNARRLQSKVPGETAHNRLDIVELLNGTKRVLETRGIGEEYLRRALDELTGQIKKQNDLLAKADTIRRIRVGAGDFSAIANVPVNSASGVSIGGANGPINITLNLNGTVLTPAQFAQFADLVGAAIKKQLTT